MKLGLSTALIFVLACNHQPTPQEVKSGGEIACSLLSAFGGTAEEQSICADATDIAAIADNIRLARADAGPVEGGKKSYQCRIIPTTTLCATDTELANAIKARKAGKK